MNIRLPLLVLSVLSLVAGGVTAADTPPGVYLADLAWPEAERRLAEMPVVIVPFAAGAKEHGPHLPMNADQVVMDWLLQQAIEAEPVLVVPPVLHGWMPAFREFPGTGIADATVFQSYIMQLSESLVRQGAQRIVFLNTGISKASGLPISIVARELRVRYRVPTLVLSWDDLETDAVSALAKQERGGHADEIETSINLYLQPENVQMDRAVKDLGSLPIKNYTGYQPGLFARNPVDPAFSRSGLYGNPTLASAATGREALQIMREEWLKALRAFAETPLAGETVGGPR